MVEPGKCIMCSSPCSSCLHIQQGLMGSALDENTRDTGLENALSCVPTTNKSARGEMGQLPEISNVLDGNSCCDSFPENAKWKFSSSTPDVSAASGEVSLLQKVECSRGSDAPSDSISCSISTKKNRRSSKFIDRDGNGINLLSCPTSTNSLDPEEQVKAPDECISFRCLDKKYDAEDIQRSSGWQGRACELSLEKVLPSTSSANDLSSQNSGLVEIQFPKNTEDPVHSTEGGKLISQVPELNVLEKNAHFPLQGKLLECREQDLNLMNKEKVFDLPHCDPPADALREENEDVGRSNKSSLLPDTRDPSHLMDDNDDSETAEQDVKVCDICGDAGREDLLAICCTCNDGAEHIYCMREMLNEVPEGDWMCEECKYNEEMKNQTQENMVQADGNEKYSSRKSIGGNSNVSLTSEEKCADEVDRINKDHSHMTILGKRFRDDVEVSSSAKKQDTQSPKESSPCSVASLSRDSSLKHMEKGKEKLLHQSPSVALVDSDSVCPHTTGLLMQDTRGTFLKSNSSGSLNAKPKVRLVDDIVPPKPEIAREPSVLDLKEGTGKSIGNSISLRTMSPGRLTSEAKVKLLSPSFSHIQDNKGPKHTKSRSLLERNSSFRSERPFVNSPRIGSVISISKGDQKPAGRVENALSSISNNRQLKAAQADSKLSTASKPSTLLSRRITNKSVSVGEAKRQLALANGCRSSEQKPTQPSSVSDDAEKPACNSKEILPDGKLHLRESADFVEKMWDNCSRFKQNVSVGGRTDICQKCEGAGHLTLFCPVESPSNLCAAKSSRDVMNGSNDLKAAIEAARLRKPGIGWKHKATEQSNCLSLASKNCEVAYPGQSSCSSIRKNGSGGELNGGHTASWYSTDRQTAVDDLNQCTKETFPIRTGDGGLVPFDGKTNVGDLSSYSPAAITVFWKLLAIPEQESTWEGNFEVHRTGEVDLFDGIQAHLSTCVSPKVLSVVNKLPQRIVLNEVPRLSTWPVQFQEFGVREDNIAVYFFAKDIVSFEKSYKNLLEEMVKNDLALKGHVDGVELLIFPSTQLPEKSQRWNMFFFLWGVFRGKKTSCPQQMPGSPKQLFKLADIPTAIMSIPENICSVGPIDKDFSSDAAASIVAEVPASTSGDGVSRIPSVTKMGGNQKINAGQQDGGVDSSCSFSPESSCTKLCEELTRTCSPRERGARSNGKSETQEVQGSVQAPGRTVFTRDEHLTNSQVNHRKNLRDEIAEEANLGVDTMSTEPIMKDRNRWHVEDSKCPHESYRITTSDVDSGGSSQSIKINYDDKDEDVIVAGIGRRQKTASDGLHGIRDQCRFSVDSFALPGNSISSGSDFANIGTEVCSATCQQKSGDSAERYFFPVDPHPVKDIERVDESVPHKIHLLEDQVRESIPNLELALGADTKPLGIPSFIVGNVDKKPSPDHVLGKIVIQEGEDNATASLSLSLSFPFSDKEQNLVSIPKSEKLKDGKTPC